MSVEHVDVLIVGAGLSGIGAAWHLQHECPDRSYLILESREAIGGTWDLFRYPGIRSDSDMYTMGYSFKPWRNPKAIADGPSILEYIRDTAREHGIERHIRFRHRVQRASWSSAQARWTVEALRDGATVRFTCNVLYFCSGYYDYAQGHAPQFPGAERFRGRIVHPQHWPEGLDHAGQRVVVIGSGATAVTLVPTMAQTAARVTMLQRSPTYIKTLPAQDKIANALRRWLPAKLAYGLARWKNVLLGMVFFRLCKRAPDLIKKLLWKEARRELGEGYDLAHFTPRYQPWDQRMCLVPDADLFKALRSGRADVVTDEIETFTENGIRLKSGRELPADIIVTATGLNMLALGGAELSVDGRAIDLAQTMTYKGMMFSDVPNLAMAIGYTNASWTLKCDLTSAYLCRLLNHMRRHGYAQATPRRNDPSVTEQPLIDFTSGYIQRAIHKFPRQGSKSPWRLYQNYALDLFTLKFGAVDDGVMEFAAASPAADVVRDAA